MRYITPLRYPGGKQRLAPAIQSLLTENDLLGSSYVEPYAGGAGAALELLFRGAVSEVHINDVSRPIAALWRSVVGAPEEMCRRIRSASVTVAEWQRQRHVLLHHQEYPEVEVGFSALFLNRCNRSGVLGGGLIGGLRQTGPWTMDARFPRNELIRRIELIATRSTDIRIYNKDAEVFLDEDVATLHTVPFVYLDPPYYERAGKLYLDRYAPSDHERLARRLQREVRFTWLLSYDNVPGIRRLYESLTTLEYDIQYSAARVYRGREILILAKGLKFPLQTGLREVDASLARYHGQAVGGVDRP